MMKKVLFSLVDNMFDIILLFIITFTSVSWATLSSTLIKLC